MTGLEHVCGACKHSRISHTFDLTCLIARCECRRFEPASTVETNAIDTLEMQETKEYARLTEQHADAVDAARQEEAERVRYQQLARTLYDGTLHAHRLAGQLTETELYDVPAAVNRLRLALYQLFAGISRP